MNINQVNLQRLAHDETQRKNQSINEWLWHQKEFAQRAIIAKHFDLSSLPDFSDSISPGYEKSLRLRSKTFCKPTQMGLFPNENSAA
jgi:hypothetical protein